MTELSELVAALGPAPPVPENRVIVSRIDSTNRLARRVVTNYAAEEMAVPGFLVLALEQSAGRGRQGRIWVSPRGCGVYATRVVPLSGEPSREGRSEDLLESLPLLAGVGLARGLAELLERGGSAGRCALKWPNDLLVDGRKVGGVLAESLTLGETPPVALVGLGVNLRRPREGSELPPGSTALADHLEASADLAGVARELVAALEAELAHLGDLAYATAAYRPLTVHRPGDRIRCRMGDEVVEGTFAGFDDRGHLVLARDGEEMRVAAGEIVEESS